MRFFFILLLLIGGSYLFFEFKVDDIIKGTIEEKATKSAERKVTIENSKINLLNEEIILKNIIIENKGNFQGNLLKINKVRILIDLKSLTEETVKLRLVDVDGVNFYYQVEIRNGQIVDNLSLINQALKQSNNNSSTNKKVFTEKKEDKNFIIKKLVLKNSSAKVISKDLNINTDTKLSNMEFLNVGNSKNANHFKDVFAMILTNIIAKVQNDILKQKVKQKFESKLKDLKKDILNDLLKGNEKDLLKKFDKLLK